MKKRQIIISYFIAIAIFLVVGLFGQWVVNNNMSDSYNQKLKLVSDLALAALDPDRTRDMAKIVTEDVSNNSEYANLTRKFVALGNIFWDEGIDALYILVNQGSNLFFMVESTPFGDPLYVAPGTMYEQPPLAVLEVASTSLTVDTDIYSDEYGTYFSRFTPIIHPDSGEQIAILGVDVYYDYYKTTLNKAIIFFWCAWLVFFLVIIMLIMYLRSLYRLKEISTINEQRIKTIGNAIGDGVVVTNRDDKITFINKAAADIFSLDENTVIGKSFKSVISISKVFDVELRQEVSNFKFSLQGGLAGRIFELVWPSKFGDTNIYEISFALASAGAEEYLVGVFHDITKRKKERLELERQTNNLEKLNSLMSGRELKMIELKKEILSLKESLAKK